MAYDALRTITPIAGWPEEPFSTSFSRGWRQFDEPIRTPAWRNLAPVFRHGLAGR